MKNIATEQLEGKHIFSLAIYGKMYRGTAKIALAFEWSDGETIHTFQLYNLLRKTEQKCIFNKWMMYGAVGAKTNSSYGKMYRQITKIALTFE